MQRIKRMLAIVAVLAALLVVAQPAYAAASVSNGTLTLSFPPRDNNVRLDMTEADGVVRVFGVPGVADGTTYTGITRVVYRGAAGDDTIQIDQRGVALPALVINARNGDLQLTLNVANLPSSQDIVSDLALTTGPGSSLINVNVDADPSAGNVVSNLAITTGAGTPEIFFDLSALPGAGTFTSNIDLDTGAGAGKVNALLDSDAQALRVGWDLNVLGGGLVNATVISDEPTQALRADMAVRTSSGNDTVETAIKSAASSLDVNLGLNTSNANDDVKAVIEQLRPIVANVNFNIDTDNGSVSADKLEVNWLGSGSTLNASGAIRTGGNNDTLKVEFGSDLVNSFTVNGGDGADSVDVLVKGRYSGGATVAGGAGDDTVSFRAEGGVSGTPTINGGAGFDSCVGAGRFVGCEQTSR